MAFARFEPTLTETLETYTYKLASEWQINLDYVIILRSSPLSPKYVNLVSIVETLLSPETSLDAMCDYLNKNTGRRWDSIVVSVLIYLQTVALEIGSIAQLGSGTGAAVELNALLDRINAFCRRRNLPLQTLASAEYARATYEREKKLSLENTEKKLRLLEETQERYQAALESDVLRISEIDILNERLVFIVKNKINREDSLTVFDDVRISSVIQHVICYTGTKTFQKVYNPGPFDPPVRKSAIISNTISNAHPGVLLFTVLLSQVYQVRYTIESGAMEVTVRIRDKTDFINAIKRGFPMLECEIRIHEIESRLNLYPTKELTFDLPMYYLLHRTVVQPHLFQFYLNESTSPAPEKSILVFRQRSFWELPSQISSRSEIRDREESTFVLSTHRMANGSNYINVTMTTSSEASATRTLSQLIPALCIFFTEDVIGKSPFFKIYNIPNLVSKSKKPGTRLRDELKHKYPEVFTPNYLNSKETNVKALVLVTDDPDEAKRWEAETIYHELTTYKRQVLPYPPQTETDEPDGRGYAIGEEPGEVLFWFTSSSPEARYISYRINDYDDSPTYPYIPFASVNGSVQKIKGISGGNVVSLAAQTEGQYAEAPDIIGHILDIDALRRGVAFGPNSAIHGILDAIKDMDKDIRATSTEEVLKVRDILTNHFHPELYKQQLYDLNNDEIVQKLGEKNEYFDPLLFSAGLEELLGIDIYYIRARIVQNVRTMTIELPRYSHFYCASRKRRNCIVMFINTGVRSDRLRWPHCELIVSRETRSPVFGPKVSERLAQIRDRCHRFMVCVPGHVYSGLYMSSAITEILGLFSEVVSQYVDPNGKARAFTVTDSAGVEVTIFCSPCAPRSLPHSTVVHSAPDREWLENLCDDTASGRSPIGVWCKHRETGELLYTRVFTPPGELPVIGMDPLTSLSGMGDSSRFASEISAKDRLALVLREVILWALDVSGLPTRRFTKRYLNYASDPDVDTELVDEASYYDISRIGRRFPAVKSMKEVFSYLDGAIPVEDGRFILHNKAYYDSIAYLVSRHAYKEYDSTEARFIKDYYRSIGDFRNDKRTLILTGNVDPLVNAIDPLNKYMIVDYIPTPIQGRLPIFYIQDGVLWIIQVTHLKEMKCAYNICRTWHMTLTNPGYNAQPAKTTRRDVLLYEVIVGRLVPVGRLEGNADAELEEGDVEAEADEDIEYEVLRLDANNFAAMLRVTG